MFSDFKLQLSQRLTGSLALTPKDVSSLPRTHKSGFESENCLPHVQSGSCFPSTNHQTSLVSQYLSFIQKTKIMASGPITPWQIDGETVETVADFIFLGSKITADGDCSHEIKTLTPWKKSYDQPRQHIKKQRHYFANKGLSSQGYGFSSGGKTIQYCVGFCHTSTS